MKVKLWSIKDNKVRTYGRPFCCFTKGEALRTCNSSLSGSSLFAKYPQDFSLWEIGDFDDQTGELTPCVRTHIANLQEIKEMYESPEKGPLAVAEEDDCDFMLIDESDE